MLTLSHRRSQGADLPGAHLHVLKCLCQCVFGEGWDTCPKWPHTVILRLGSKKTLFYFAELKIQAARGLVVSEMIVGTPYMISGSKYLGQVT